MLSENIRKYRKLNQMSQDELADRLEVTRQSISLWETGQTQPSLDKIVAMAKLFGVSTDSLLTFDEVQPAAEAVAFQPQAPKKKNSAVLTVVIFLLVVGILAVSLFVFNSVFSIWGETEPSATEQPAPDIRELYSYLKDFVVNYGKLNGDYCYYSKPADNYGGYSDEDFSLYYWGDTDTLEFCLHSVLNETFSINFYLRIPEEHTGNYEYVSSYYYRDTGEPLYEARGTIKASEFTKNYPLNCSKYIGATDKQNSFMEESRVGVCDLLDCLKQFLSVEGLKYSFEDLGFTKFQ